MILCLLFLNVTPRCDSLETALAQDCRIEALIELSRCFVAAAEYHRSMELLKSHERSFTKEADRARLMYETGSVCMFAGDIVKAHETYLRLLGTHAASDIANDAAERIYLFETARDDTTQLRRLINVVRLFETGQYRPAADSTKNLLKDRTRVGAYAYYYLALAYEAQGDLPLASGALEELNRVYQNHRVHEAVLLQADVYTALGKTKDAVEVLEDAIVRAPNTIYALKARQKLAALKFHSDK
ncbi:tetratricopeptide repeat protein [candidate division WOR-3 bacterium]|nr:tetratricopeptide repeat protein [candidate division WOR-3 bacterium]